MLEVVILFFLSLTESLFFIQPWIIRILWIPWDVEVEIVVQHDVEAVVPIFRWNGHVELSWKKSQRYGGAWKTNTKVSLWDFFF
jgi:hypothetical protein